MGRRGQGVRAQRWCNVMLGAAKGVQLGGIRPGESCHDGRVHPSTGGQQLHRGTDCRLADLEAGTTSIECEVDAR